MDQKLHAIGRLINTLVVRMWQVFGVDYVKGTNVVCVAC